MIRILEFGVGLMAFGAFLTVSSHLIIGEVSLTALGLACIILGAAALLTPTQPIPRNALKTMVEEACINVEALLEEFNVSGKAVYMPPRDGRVYAFTPISSNPYSFEVKSLTKAPLRMITSVDGKAGLFIFPPGSEAVKLVDVEKGLDVEEAVRLVLVEFLEGAESVKAFMENNTVTLEISNPSIGIDFPQIKKVLGSYILSVAGCAMAWALNRPIIFEGETLTDGVVRADFKVL